MDSFKCLLDVKQLYIVGVSGGVDSMALLDMLYRANYRIVVAHVNYNFRHDSNLDQKTVEDYCHQRNISCFVKNVDNKIYGNDNFENLARQIRYQFYFEVGQVHKSNQVILAHHQGDVLENIVMQLQRHNTKGYLGIRDTSEVNQMMVIRPLLEMKKEELQSYCLKHQVAYRDDYTNFENNYTRNYIRNVTLKEYDDIEKVRLLQQANEHNQRYLRKLTTLKPYLDKYYQAGKINYHLIENDLLEVFIYEIVKLVVYPPLISDALIQEIIKQIKSDKPNIIVDLPVNTRFIKEYDNIYVSNLKNPETYCLKYDHLVYDKHEYFYLSPTGHLNEGVYVQENDFPLTIRTIQDGDVIVTAGGTKKISRLFIDNKIPKSMRNTWPIVENGQGIVILVPHLAKNIRYLYSKPNIYVVKLRTYMTRSETNA